MHMESQPIWSPANDNPDTARLSVLQAACWVHVLVYMSVWGVNSEFDCVKSRVVLKLRGATQAQNCWLSAFYANCQLDNQPP